MQSTSEESEAAVQWTPSLVSRSVVDEVVGGKSGLNLGLIGKAVLPLLKEGLTSISICWPWRIKMLKGKSHNYHLSQKNIASYQTHPF